MKKRQDRAEMEQLLRLREEEGLTYRELAEQSGIPLHTLHYWSGKIRRESDQAKGVGVFLPIEVTDPEPGPAIVIEVGQAIRVVVEPNFEPGHLARVVRALSEPC